MTTVPAIRATGIWKRFGAVQANRDASLDVAAGSIHAVVGENGAGKSTLMRLLAGLHAPDRGRVEIHGKEVTGWSARDAIAGGVGMVHQHFMLVPTLTVAENVVLGREPRRGARLDRDGANQAVRSTGAESGLVVAPHRLVADLSVGEAQRVEVLKVLYRGARILILDEPTAVLSPPEVTELWGVLRRLASSGTTVVLITHKLDEVMAISDEVTVMRAGHTVGRVATGDATPASLAWMMVGREVALGQPSSPVRNPRADSPNPGTAALAISGLTIGAGALPLVDDLSLTVAPGEILGLAGVEGNGQTELVEAIAGLREISSGSVRLGDRDITHLSVRARADAGLSHIPEDRHRRGLILDYSVAENLILGQQHRYATRWRMDRIGIGMNATRRVAMHDIRPADHQAPVRTLSGGNQQKVVIARELGRDFTVLLAAQPTRGVDVGAIEFIHEHLREAARKGKGILLVSADLNEVLALSDRIAVMYEGHIVVTLPRADATVARLGEFMTGAARDGGASTREEMYRDVARRNDVVGDDEDGDHEGTGD